MPRNLNLYKGYQNGIEQGTLYEIDENGNKTAFNLTSATVSLEIYKMVGKTATVVATISGTVNDAANGVFTVRPGLTALDSLTTGDYYWRIKVVNSNFPDKGRVFDTDSDNRLYRCTIS